MTLTLTSNKNNIYKAFVQSFTGQCISNVLLFLLKSTRYGRVLSIVSREFTSAEFTPQTTLSSPLSYKDSPAGVDCNTARQKQLRAKSGRQKMYARYFLIALIHVEHEDVENIWI